MADRLKEFVGDLPKDCTLLIPGTGVKDGMDRVVNKEGTVTFEECGLGLGEGVSGHGRDISLGTVTHEGRKSNVVVLSRIHPNEDFADPELVRVPRHIIEALQPKIAGAIITNGVGGLSGRVGKNGPLRDVVDRRTGLLGRAKAGLGVGRELLTGKGRESLMDQATSVVRQAVLDIAGMAIKGRPLRETTPGDILVIESIFASLMNSLNPLRAPEFVDVQANGYERDNARYVKLALEAVREVQGYCESAGIYGYAPGPNFETPVEKIVFRLVADVVGMSAAHEVMILTKLNIPFAHIALITNGPFVTHSHEDNGAVGKSSADKCGQILQVLVDKMARLGKEEEFERSLPHSATL